MLISDKRRAQLVAGPYTRLLAEHEGAMAALYDTLANSITSAESFWRTMSREEMIHQNLVLKIDENLQKGEWKFKRPMFVTSGIVDSLEWIANHKSEVETKGISMREALKLALNLETGMIEANFFDVLDSDDAVMIEVVETQTAYTKAHIRRLQKEAKRLKWRIFGSRKLFPKGEAKTLTRGELKTNIKAAQANMLGMLIAMEEAASRLYIAFSERVPGYSIWGVMAAEELQHATMLKTLYKLLEDGKVFYNVEHFNRKTLEEITAFIQNAEFDARHEKLSRHQAVCIALKIEKSMTEHGFYSTVTSDAPEFQIIAARLVQLTKEHVVKLDEEMVDSARAGEASQKNIPIPAPGN